VKLPDVAARIHVEPEKITAYLLVPEHPQNQGKAHFFLAFGFRHDVPETMIAALIAHARAHEVTTVENRSYATVYTVEGELSTPDGRRPHVRTVWHITLGTDVARFITAVPRTKGRGSR
jgi:hypothetical protein